MLKANRTSRQSVSSVEKTSAYHSYEREPFALPLQIESSGSALWSGSRFFARDRSDIFGIEYVVAGSVDFVQDGKHCVVAPGEAYLLRKGSRHLYKVGHEGFLLKRFIVVSGVALDPLLRATSLQGCDHVRPVRPTVVAQLMKKANGILRAKRSGFALELSEIAYRILLELGRSTTLQYPEPVRAALEFIQQNLSAPLSCREICGKAGVSMTHFNRIFREAIGVSPLQYFIAQRMSWGKHLLRQTSMSVKEVALAIGYEDPLYFSSRFKEHTGMSPKAFRADTDEGEAA